MAYVRKGYKKHNIHERFMIINNANIFMETKGNTLTQNKNKITTRADESGTTD